MSNPVQPFEAFQIWYKTLLRQPPTNEWFMGRYGGEVMPTFIINGLTCISVRLNPETGALNVIQHTKALPPEWRP